MHYHICMGKKRPRFVDISYRCYGIEFLSVYGNDEGFVDKEKGLIGIGMQESEDTMRSTLLHEILHALIKTYNILGYEVAEGDEENIVRRLEAPLFEVMKKNPHIIKYLWLDADDNAQESTT